MRGGRDSRRARHGSAAAAPAPDGRARGARQEKVVRLRGDGGAVPQQTMKVPPRAQRGALCTPVAARARAQGCAACTGGRRTAAAASCLSCLTPPCSAPPALPGSRILQAPRHRASAAAGRATRRSASGAPGAACAGFEAGGRAPGRARRRCCCRAARAATARASTSSTRPRCWTRCTPGAACRPRCAWSTCATCRPATSTRSGRCGRPAPALTPP